MSFLQHIIKNSKEKYFNPVVHQLQRTHYSPKRNNPKPDSKPATVLLCHLPKQSARLQIDLTFLKEGRYRCNNSRTGYSTTRNTQRGKQSKDNMKQRSQIVEANSHEGGGRESRRSNPDSFSNYLSRYEHGYSAVCLQHRKKYQYFNIDELASNIVSPKKLSRKIIQNDSIESNNSKKQIKVSPFQRYLQQIDSGRDQYQKRNKPPSIHQETRVQTKHSFLNTLHEDKATHRATSIWKKKTNAPKIDKHDRLLPWRQNEQEHSPLQRKLHRLKRQVDNFDDFAQNPS